MSKDQYEVEVTYLCEFKKTLTIWASDEHEAEDKAEELVSAWSNIYEVVGAEAQ